MLTIVGVALGVVLITQHASLATQWPSLFRGVVVADAPAGVRVVSVDETSQAYQADLRPEDIIVRVHDAEVHSIDEFAVLSGALRGRIVSTTVVVFRNGTPRELTLHLYSYPLLSTWGIQFVPDHDLRFAQSSTGWAYWLRLGRGFEVAGKDAEALNAYLNGLHHMPTDVETAVNVARLFARAGQRLIRDGQLADGLMPLGQAVQVMRKLFDYPLSDEQLSVVREQLQGTLQAIHDAKANLHPRSSSRLLANQTVV